MRRFGEASQTAIQRLVMSAINGENETIVYMGWKTRHLDNENYFSFQKKNIANDNASQRRFKTDTLCAGSMGSDSELSPQIQVPIKLLI